MAVPKQVPQRPALAGSGGTPRRRQTQGVHQPTARQQSSRACHGRTRVAWRVVRLQFGPGAPGRVPGAPAPPQPLHAACPRQQSWSKGSTASASVDPATASLSLADPLWPPARSALFTKPSGGARACSPESNKQLLVVCSCSRRGATRTKGGLLGRAGGERGKGAYLAKRCVATLGRG